MKNEKNVPTDVKDGKIASRISQALFWASRK